MTRHCTSRHGRRERASPSGLLVGTAACGHQQRICLHASCAAANRHDRMLVLVSSEVLKMMDAICFVHQKVRSTCPRCLCFGDWATIPAHLGIYPGLSPSSRWPRRIFADAPGCPGIPVVSVAYSVTAAHGTGQGF